MLTGSKKECLKQFTVRKPEKDGLTEENEEIRWDTELGKMILASKKKI